jgi:hypothetical protein
LASILTSSQKEVSSFSLFLNKNTLHSNILALVVNPLQQEPHFKAENSSLEYKEANPTSKSLGNLRNSTFILFDLKIPPSSGNNDFLSNLRVPGIVVAVILVFGFNLWKKSGQKRNKQLKYGNKLDAIKK